MSSEAAKLEFAVNVALAAGDQDSCSTELMSCSTPLRYALPTHLLWRTGSTSCANPEPVGELRAYFGVVGFDEVQQRSRVCRAADGEMTMAYRDF
jgi:hypothetical protein